MSNDRRLEMIFGRAQRKLMRVVVTAATGVRRAETRVDGVTMPFLYRGHAEPVVLIHGFGNDKEIWSLTLTALPRTFRIVVPDMPGYGEAGRIDPERASPDAQADALRGFLDRLGIVRAHLVGNSMGGGISLRFAMRYPERVRTLTLLCSVGPEAEKSELDLALDRGENLLIPRTVEEAERMLALAVETMPPVPQSLQRYEAARRVADADNLERMFAGWSADGLHPVTADDLARIEAPALVIHGAADRIIHPSVGRAIGAGLPNARYEEWEGVGHVPHVEAPRRVGRAVTDFIRAHRHG